MKNLSPRKVNEFFWDCKLISEWTGIHSNVRVTLYHSFLNTLLNLLVRSFILLRLFWLWASQVKLVVRNSPVNAEDTREAGSIPESGRFPWRRSWQPAPIFLPGESRGQRSLEVTKSQTQLKQLRTQTQRHAHAR